MPTPGQTQHNLTDGPDVVSKAALFGGTTTMLDFALVDGDNTVQQAIERRQKEWAGDCACDYAFHVMVQGKLDWSVPDQIMEAVQAGHATVKMFTTDITPSRKGRMVPFGSIMEVLTALAKSGGPEKFDVDVVQAFTVNPEAFGYQHRLVRVFFREGRHYLLYAPNVDVDLTTEEVRVVRNDKMHDK